MTRLRLVIAALVVAVTTTGCVQAKRPSLKPSPAEPGASLWRQPADLASRDLYHGQWGPEYAPNPHSTYTLVKRKRTGVNLGMTVKDPQGREWSVKQAYPGGLDAEGPVEVVVSRLLGAAGYHQPPVYYLPAFSLKDDWGTHVEAGGRFRLKDDAIDEVDEWRWEENPFIGTREYQGLLVLLMMFNSTDMKNSNNSIYERKVGGRVERWYVARDIGSALGDTHRIAPRKGDPGAFEREPFILGVENGHVQFAYKGWYQKYVQDRITPEDVAWASSLLARLSDRQWRDAFRAGGYEPAVAERFIAKLKEKVQQGQSLTRHADVRPGR